jgi:uncharacterized lipoprotein
MLRAIVIGACLIATLAACVTDNGQSRKRSSATAADTSVTGACLTDSGPRPPLSQAQCPAHGRSYSGKELQQTGEVNVGEALRMLDPSVSIQH